MGERDFSKAEKTAEMERQMLRFPLIFCDPVLIGRPPAVAGDLGPSIFSATVTYLELYGRKMGVTNAHVIRFYKAERAKDGATIFQLPTRVLDNVLDRLIDIDDAADLATIELSDVELPPRDVEREEHRLGAPLAPYLNGKRSPIDGDLARWVRTRCARAEELRHLLRQGRGAAHPVETHEHNVRLGNAHAVRNPACRVPDGPTGSAAVDDGHLHAKHLARKGRRAVLHHRLAYDGGDAIAVKQVHPRSPRQTFPARAFQHGEHRCVVQMPERIAVVRVNSELDGRQYGHAGRSGI